MADKFDDSLFEDTKYVAPEDMDDSLFDDTPAEQPAPDVSAVEAAGLGAQQGLTFGFADEIGAGMQSGMDRMQRMLNEYTGLVGESPSQVNERLRAEGASGDIGPTTLSGIYNQALQENREQLNQAEDQQGAAFMAGDLAGGVLIPGGALKTAGKAALKAGGKGLAKKALSKKAIAAGAGIGGVEAAGRTEEDLTTLDGATDVAGGAAMGGVFSGLLGKIGKRFSEKGIKKAADQTSKDANIAALKSIGAKAKNIKDELGVKTNTRATADTAKGSGQTLIDEALIAPRQSIDEVKQNIVNQMDRVAKERINPAAKQLDEMSRELPLGTFADDFNTFAQKVDDDVTAVIDGSDFAKASDQALYKSMEKATQKLGEQVDNALNSPNKIEELVKIKRKLQKQVNWDDPQANAYNEFLVKMQSNVADMINGMSQKIDPETAAKMTDANKVYSNLSRTNRIAGDEMARELAKDEGIGFRDYLAAGVISAVGDNRLLGPAVIGGKKAIERVSGKDTGKLLNTLEAFQKSRKAKRLATRAQNRTRTDRALNRLDSGSGGARAAQAGAVAVDSQNPDKNYNKNKIAAEYIEQASPERLQEASKDIARKYGKDGAKLASTLQRISEKDRVGRRALLFSIMQDPNNRKMLGLDDKE